MTNICPFCRKCVQCEHPNALCPEAIKAMQSKQLLKDLEKSEKSGIAFSGTGKAALEYLDKMIEKDKQKLKATQG